MIAITHAPFQSPIYMAVPPAAAAWKPRIRNLRKPHSASGHHVQDNSIPLDIEQSIATLAVFTADILEEQIPVVLQFTKEEAVACKEFLRPYDKTIKEMRDLTRTPIWPDATDAAAALDKMAKTLVKVVDIIVMISDGEDIDLESDEYLAFESKLIEDAEKGPRIHGRAAVFALFD